MIEHPIIFTAKNVRAILEGRKTQTRRVVKGKWIPLVEEVLKVNGKWVFETLDYDLTTPYGKPGDTLWVRETWKIASFMEGEPVEFQYRADGAECEENEHAVEPGNNYDEWYERISIRGSDYLTAMKWPEDDEGIHHWDRGMSPLPWQSPIHMPRWGSRIDLEIKSIRVERLQDITLEDIAAEGWPDAPKDKEVWTAELFELAQAGFGWFTPLWDLINAKRDFPWMSNPFVWVIEAPMIIKPSAEKIA